MQTTPSRTSRVSALAAALPHSYSLLAGRLVGQALCLSNLFLFFECDNRHVKTACLLAVFCAATFAADPKPLFNGKNLDGWEIIGDGQWTVMADGTLLGQRITDLRKQFVPGGPLATPAAFKAGWIRSRGFTPRAMISANSICTWSIGPRPPAIAGFRFGILRAPNGA